MRAYQSPNTVTVRTISGHQVNTPISDVQAKNAGVIANDPSSNIARRLSSSQPNTDRRRFVVGR